MRKATLALLSLATVALLATPVTAHQTAKVIEDPVTGDIYYFFTDHGATSIFKEANGVLDQGVWQSADGTGVTGLQFHNVCFGTYTAHDVAHWNEHNVGYTLIDYLPFHGSEEDCDALGGTFVVADTLLAGEPGEYGHEH